MERVFSAPNALMVDHLRNVLDAEGVDCLIRNRYSSSAAGELPPAETWLELWVVDDGEVERARTIVAQAMKPSDASASWTCSACGEEAGSRFSNCWHCGAERGETKVPAGFQPVDTSSAARGGSSIGYVVTLAVGIALGAGLAAIRGNPEPSGGDTVKTVDYNDDGKTDFFVVYIGDKLARVEVDRNFDGTLDEVVRYDDHQLQWANLDDDFDGHFEAQLRYKFEQLSYATYDYDGDGAPDREESYESGVLREVVFLDGDCVVSRQRFEGGRLAYSDHDRDCDDRFESRTFYDAYESPLSVPQGSPNETHSGEVTPGYPEGRPHRTAPGLG